MIFINIFYFKSVRFSMNMQFDIVKSIFFCIVIINK